MDGPAQVIGRGSLGRRGAIWLLAVLVVVAGVGPIAWHYLRDWPQDQWQVDLQVYREAGRSILFGRPVYEELTEPPQLLPFTYPPFAALLATPIALVPFGLLAWLWTAAQVAATAVTVWIAGRPLLRRAGRWWPAATALLTVVMVWLQPLSDGIRFGQVNAFIVLACLVDLAAVRPRWARGVLIGLATAVKLTPGTFLLYFAWTRRWRPALGLAAGAVVATVASFLVLPEASLAFWGGALQDPNRLGPNKRHLEPVDPRRPAAAGSERRGRHAAVDRSRRWPPRGSASGWPGGPTSTAWSRSRSARSAWSPSSSRRCPGSTTSRGWPS